MMLHPLRNVGLTRRERLSQVSIQAPAATAMALGAREANGQTPPATAADLGFRIYNSRDLGAKGDGKTIDTAALQSAIAACTAAGGGTVLVPAGTFLIGTVELNSNVTLHIAASGKLLGTTDGTQYHAVDSIPLSGDSTLNDGNWPCFMQSRRKM